MRPTLLERLRRRPAVAIATSLAMHLLVLGALVWVRPPVGRYDVKRGEPLFVELPKADEEALRGLPGAPAPVPDKPAPPAARPAPAPKPAPRAEPKPAAPRPPVLAKSAPRPAVPLPKEDLAPEPAKPASAKPDIPPDKPAVAEAKPPVLQPKEAPREAAEAPPTPRVASVPPTPDIRSPRPGAPGTGGAGGRGEGRAGIEGEPIPLDSKDPRYSDYLDRVRRMIKEKWAYPCVKDEASGRCDYKSTSLVIEFGILKDGRVPFVTVRRPSDFDVYDAYAVNAILFASPFPPVPDSLTRGKNGIPILANFSYIVESSLTNLLR